MSTIEVNKIIPQGSGTSVQLGESGDTITIPSGATITNNGTASGFGGDLVNDTSPQLGGDLDTNGHDIDFKDTDKAVFGTGSDFEIVHNPVSGNLLNLAANPLEMHQVGGNSVLQLYRDPGNGVIAQFFGGTTQAGSINTDTVSSSPSLEINAVGSFAVRTNNGTERMRILSDGNVGIGTASPDTSSYFGKILHLAGSSNVGIMFNRTDSTAAKWSIGCNSAANLDFVKEGAVQMRITSGGVVTMGTTSVTGNTSRLELKGTESPLSITNETALH